jgi:hypothetical protein
MNELHGIISKIEVLQSSQSKYCQMEYQNAAEKIGFLSTFLIVFLLFKRWQAVDFPVATEELSKNLK